MDLIYTNASRVDQGVLLDYDLDLAFGTDENNFECKIIADAHCCVAGSYIYIEGTEYGGIVDSIESDSTNNEVIYKGRTWHGILNSKIIMPDSGEDYLILSGEAASVLRSLITRLGLSDLFTVADSQGSIQISNYKVPRYIEAYEGIIKMLNSVSSKLSIAYSNGSCVLRAVPRADYSNDEEFDTSVIPLKVTKVYNTVNHLVVLGSGELKNRLVLHLYADADGNISQQQTFTGSEEYSAVYELSSEGDSDKLLEDGTAYFKDLLSTGEIEISLDSDNEDYGISDIFGSYDNITKMFVAEKITKKIVKISDGKLSVEYETKKTTATSAESGGSSGGGSGSSGVDSVNGKTGAVELAASDVGALSSDGGAVAYVMSQPKTSASQVRFHFLPYVQGSTIGDHSTVTETAIQNLIKWICQNYPNVGFGTWLGVFRPNSTGLTMINIQNTADLASNGLPNVCVGFYEGIGEFYTFSNLRGNWVFTAK